MSNRTAAQFAADRKRSHKAKAKAEQKVVAKMFLARAMLVANGHSVEGYTSALATTARMARSHLNFVLTGQYADFA